MDRGEDVFQVGEGREEQLKEGGGESDGREPEKEEETNRGDAKEREGDEREKGVGREVQERVRGGRRARVKRLLAPIQHLF